MATTITSAIVKVNATITAAPAPSQFQQSGALVSVGGTTLTTNSYAYYGTLAAVEAVLSTAGNYAELQNMATTFFAQGNAVGLYVLELGVQTAVTNGITALETWITANPGVFYSYLTPASWDTDGAALNTMAANYSGATGKTYFFVTTSETTYSAYGTTKSIIATAPSPTAPSSVFQSAEVFYAFLSTAPSIAAPAAPIGFRFVTDAYPWPLANNQNTINSLLTANVNIILSGAEGGISTSTIRNGTTMDGNQMMFWYAVDWIQIQAKLSLANAIINGSNSNPPLYYNQPGINTLLAVLENVGASGVAFGLLLSATFTATPFYTYTQANPSNYAAGIYDGFACTATPQLGFEQITFNLDATTFA
ncbi:hypothetical protein [Acidiphilium sp.]|uniref:hypothetical protein n=1 Tax=Acidiphilium sp. TaxID=527 RepID=UPI003CFE577E